MKVMARINRGAILTAVVLIAVITYLLVLSAVRSAEEPAIIELCGDYVKTEVQYSMLPEKYRSAKPDMTAAAKEQYLADMTSAMGAFFVRDEQIRKFSLDGLKTRLEPQMRGEKVIYDYQKTIKKYVSFVYDKGIVTVTLTTNTIYDGPGFNSSGLTSRQRIVQETTDTLVLQQEDGQWRVVYANLTIPENGYGKYSGMEAGVMYK